MTSETNCIPHTSQVKSSQVKSSQVKHTTFTKITASRQVTRPPDHRNRACARRARARVQSVIDFHPPEINLSIQSPALHAACSGWM